MRACMCVCVCVCERERGGIERERQDDTLQNRHFYWHIIPPKPVGAEGWSFRKACAFEWSILP